MYIRIKEVTTGLYVGFGDKEVELIFDLFTPAADDQIYTAPNFAHAEVMCNLVNKVSKLIYPLNKWSFVVEHSFSWYPENGQGVLRSKATATGHKPIRI